MKLIDTFQQTPVVVTIVCDSVALLGESTLVNILRWTRGAFGLELDPYELDLVLQAL